MAAGSTPAFDADAPPERYMTVRLLQKSRAQSLTGRVADYLVAEIGNGALPPGSKLPTEHEIMSSQGVSRTVVREAISSLQAAGLVETRHGIGTFVLNKPKRLGIQLDASTITTMRDLMALLELRISLETEAAGLTAVRRSDEQLRALREALDALQASLKSGENAIGADFHFHLQIASATGNHYFIDIMTHLGEQVIPRSRLNTAQIEDDERLIYLDRVQHEHETIYEAIANRDTGAARAAMRYHLTNSRERLRKAQEVAQTLAEVNADVA
jgi:DNA-binding FadR family transcriptional regulator